MFLLKSGWVWVSSKMDVQLVTYVHLWKLGGQLIDLKRRITRLWPE